MSAQGPHTEKKSPSPISTNRKARHDYEVLEKIEAGLQLTGTEVKSLRQGQVGLAGAFARVQGRELWLFNVNIPPYACGNRNNHDPLRPRRLLLHRGELDKLIARMEQKGLALVPLSISFKGSWAKASLGICRGKTHGDKRETLRRKTADREAQRAMGQHRGR